MWCWLTWESEQLPAKCAPDEVEPRDEWEEEVYCLLPLLMLMLMLMLLFDYS
jgi:hypothetical protein